MTRALRAVAFGLIVTGLLTLGYAGAIVIDARTYQSAARQQFEHLKRLAPIARTVAPA